MPSRSIINHEATSSGVIATYTVPDSVTSGAITCLSITNFAGVAAGGDVLLNGIVVAADLTLSDNESVSIIVRVGLVAGDVVEAGATASGVHINVTAALTGV